MEYVKEGCLFKIISHEVEYGVYEGEILLELNIDSELELSTGVEKQILELHFGEDEKSYICSMIYDLDESGESDDIGRYYSLNNDEIKYIKEYIEEKELPFILK